MAAGLVAIKPRKTSDLLTQGVLASQCFTMKVASALLTDGLTGKVKFWVGDEAGGGVEDLTGDGDRIGEAPVEGT